MLQPDIRLLKQYPTFQDFRNNVTQLLIKSELVPEEILAEYDKISDLIEVCYFKYNLFEIAQLQTIMLFEKALRMRLYDEYKTITKIKFSVLLDKVQQLELLSKEIVVQFRVLKDLRNKTVHHGTEILDHEMALKNIDLLMSAITEIFTKQKAPISD